MVMQVLWFWNNFKNLLMLWYPTYNEWIQKSPNAMRNEYPTYNERIQFIMLR